MRQASLDLLVDIDRLGEWIDNPVFFDSLSAVEGQLLLPITAAIGAAWRGHFGDQFGRARQMAGLVEGTLQAPMAHPDDIGNDVLVGGKDHPGGRDGSPQAARQAPGMQRGEENATGILMVPGRCGGHVGASPSIIS